mmetsp:Transcript_27084/g.58984  ORF Transcript_27084/g.58984 Transcript_27084/m.58984 type:complete len:675 (-) Transcript_27084:67-2091(-)|eukprot:CAMPEP_0206476934 /NCGR_PEP_ID=MMETSP0324_2-20121206/35039_1 /ASSEMBLY_ACC=CAM_ASM_000836 /TAXON_ID=2866 /ORGANISM="Crypthecodinium cohnii, Strain Seligo" /LENGTH=674 /DNA_ID=CAMNT_0053952715 /DNA_START=210 /DNA_END=2234 /DNA_ORIENTATION=+
MPEGNGEEEARRPLDSTVSADSKKGFRLPILLSPYHWIHLFSSKLSGWVSCRVLAAVCVAEFLGHCMFATVYIKYQLLTSNAILLYDWYWWFTLAVIRGLICLFGLYVIVRRNVQLVRIYFLLYIINTVLGCGVFAPIFRTSCRCDRYLQCDALKSFETSEPLINSFAPPNSEWAKKRKTRMRVQALPDRGEKISLAASLELARKLGVADNQQDDDDDDVAASASFAQFEASAREWTNITSRRLGDPEQAAKRILAWWRGRAVRKSEVTDDGMLGMFYASPQRFRWIAADVRVREKQDGKCTPLDVRTPLEAWAIQSKMDSLRDNRNFGRTNVLDVGSKKVLQKINKCFAKPTCQLIEIRMDWSSGTPKMGLCKVSGSLELREATPEQEVPTSWNFQFRREDRRPTAGGGRQSIYQLKSSSMTSSAGMLRVSRALERECVCDPMRSGCKAHSSTEDDKFWCWISNTTVHNCVARNFSVWYSKKRDAYWTEDVCNPPMTTCSCTHLGMYPRDTYKLPSNIDSLLWENKLNFGSYCENWREGDDLQWCYVGFDSNCVDKFGRGSDDYYSTELGGDLRGTPLQFKSRLPCNNGSQEKAFSNAQTYCLFVIYAMVFVFGIEMCSKLPVMFMLHLFLAHRCADTVVVEEQFEVSWTDDEWELDVEEDGKKGKDDKDGDD